MSKIDKHPIIWPLERHTKAKHIILREYLHAWFPIMQSRNRKLLFIDGFAGPGVYIGGEPGSPIVAINALRDHAAFGNWNDREFLFLFCEPEPGRFASLDERLNAAAPFPKNVTIGIESEEFDDVVTDILDDLDKKGSGIIPTFAFLDPFGVKGLAMETVRRLMAKGTCEIVVNLAVKNMGRFATQPVMEPHLDALYGDDRWKDAQALPVREREELLVQLYLDALHDHVKVKYRWNFKMVSRGTPSYHLVYGTNHPRGLEKMKDAMWKVDPNGTFTFSSSTPFGQYDFFSPAALLGTLPDELEKQFAGQTVTPEKVTEFVLEATPYRKGHVKQQTLQPMEKAGRIKVQRPGKSGFPDGRTTITFPPLPAP